MIKARFKLVSGKVTMDQTENLAMLEKVMTATKAAYTIAQENN